MAEINRSVDGQRADVELSVVIPAFNAASTIGEQLRSILDQDYPANWEVVVADNGSSDETVEVVAAIAAHEERVRLVDAGRTAGPSAARNCGVESAQGTSILFCDADDVVAEGWLAAMGEALRGHVAVTGPQETDVLNPPWLSDSFGMRRAQGLLRFEGVFPFGSTANLGINRELFRQIGGFDESLHVAEDLDLCMRLWLHDVALTWVPEGKVHYRYRPASGAQFRQAFSYGRAAPMISRRLADRGAKTPRRWAGAKRWVWLIRRLPSVRTDAGRARWIVVVGTSAGRLVGSARHQFLLL